MGVSANNLGVRAGEDWLFRELDLAVAEGECLALTGSNGSGKSTLLRCLYGTQRPTEGQVRIFGQAPDERVPEFRRLASVLMDDSALFDELSPRQHLELLTRSYPGSPEADQELFASAGLDARMDVPAGKLSAGQRRRLLLLGAIARPHQLLLLDEPERALDAAGREWLVELVRAAKSRGAVVVVASHHLALVEDVADWTVDL
ncbi:ABC transporter ATP-binding protein [Kutzneria albida]|uniref:ABC transporter domain-containing protein n=1 Tax=Kutzneria albida DSM 43870 TaxID=1449976 RepID=W5WLH2_9PSEU|nr:ABC transporter ATP-binding protein [Kutzneria albida]AHI02074.1 hypothetical protein KALB_8717 [Kutzneria albida DSM 43870]